MSAWQDTAKIRVQRTLDGIRSTDAIWVVFRLEHKPTAHQCLEFSKWIRKKFEGRDMNALMVGEPTNERIAHVLEGVAMMFFVGSNDADVTVSDYH